MKNLNERCPLQGECEHKCKHVGHEQDCKYYQGNARPGYEIPDLKSTIDCECGESEININELLTADTASDGDTASAGHLVLIPIGKLSPHKDNPRKDLGDLSELAESIKENGILQNLTVVRRHGEITGDPLDCYTVIIGHRRLAAAKLAGIAELPCVIADMNLHEQVRTMLMENMQRADLTVYEQAQGFQLMLNLGDSVDEIAQKSGFSQTTVRRRVKLLELDQDKFKASVDRGATLSDYMELDKITDPELKNTVLDAIGTNNFRNKLQQAVETEKQKKYLQDVIPLVAGFATQVEEIDSNKMQYIRNFCYWNRTRPVEKPDDTDTRSYYYRIGRDQVDLYADKVDTPKDTAAEIERNRIKEEFDRHHSELKEITRRAYQLRYNFVANYSGCKKHVPEILKAAGRFCFAADEGDSSLDYEILTDLLGIEWDTPNDDFSMAAYDEQMKSRPEYTLLATLFASVNDEKSSYWDQEWNYEKRAYQFVHADNALLDELYAFLQELGYQMSDEEKAMQDGTHLLFRKSPDNNGAEVE